MHAREKIKVPFQFSLVVPMLAAPLQNSGPNGNKQIAIPKGFTIGSFYH